MHRDTGFDQRCADGRVERHREQARRHLAGILAVGAVTAHCQGAAADPRPASRRPARSGAGPVG